MERDAHNRVYPSRGMIGKRYSCLCDSTLDERKSAETIAFDILKSYWGRGI